MQQFSRKEKYMMYNTLNCVPFLLQGQAVLIDLRNETSVAGRIDNADGYMNISLVEVVFIDRDGLQYPFEQFMVRQRMIRQIHLPADFDVKKEIHDMVDNGLHRREPQPKKNLKRTFKTKRAETRHQEILQEIEKQKLEKQKLEETKSDEKGDKAESR